MGRDHGGVAAAASTAKGARVVADAAAWCGSLTRAEAWQTARAIQERSSSISFCPAVFLLQYAFASPSTVGAEQTVKVSLAEKIDLGIATAAERDRVDDRAEKIGASGLDPRDFWHAWTAGTAAGGPEVETAHALNSTPLSRR